MMYRQDEHRAKCILNGDYEFDKEIDLNFAIYRDTDMSMKDVMNVVKEIGNVLEAHGVQYRMK